MGLAGILVFLSGVVMGTGSTITIKVIYGLEAIGVSGGLQRFEKPLFTTWVMFLAMCLALPVHFGLKWLKQHKRRQASYERGFKAASDLTSSASTEHSLAELEDEDPDLADIEWRTYFLLIIPACFDLLGTALAGVGLLFTSVSVYQLVRCTVIIVTALLKVFVLKMKLTRYMWFGIFVNTVAMVLVSSTSFLPGATVEQNQDMNGNFRDPRIGIMFILLSCLVQGSQYVFEEKVMAVDNAPPLIVVGMEGLWGTLLMPLVVFPWAYILPGTDVGGCVENIYDAFVMTANSTSIQIVLAIFTVTVMMYNIFCIYVTFLLNSIWHAILDNFRPISVWATDLALFYIFTSGTFGESWNTGSWLELAGMILLFLGTAIYNGSVQVPGFDYPAIAPLDDGQSEVERLLTPQIRTSQQMASPFLTRSPLVNRAIYHDKQRRLSGSFESLKPHQAQYGSTIHDHLSSRATTQSNRQN